MLKSLEIKNFRTFAELQIAKLGQVNLIMGKNNVGKTTLLEALQIYGSAWPARTAQEVLDYRSEVMGTTRPGSVLSIPTFFHGREAGAGTASSIGPLTSGNGRPTLRITASIEEDVNFDKVHPSDKETPFPWGPQLALNFGFDPPGPSSSTLYPSRRARFSSEGFDTNAIVPMNPKPLLLRLTSIPAMLGETADRWDVILLHPAAEERVVRLLRSLAPICDLRYISLGESGRTAFVQIEQQPDRVPLISLGEGLGHVFRLAVALQFAAAVHTSDHRRESLANMFPLLLIDEFETGIHHTLQADVWRFVLNAALELGVQVFATTHSWDCVKGFARVVQEVPECDALAIRLERVEGKERTGAITFDRSELRIVARESIEVR
jgi:hypothetical protein